jgi:putative oxidoreductase
MSALPRPGYVSRLAGDAAPLIRTRPRTARVLGEVDARLQAIETACQPWLIAHSIAILRVSLGAIFLAFGLLKFFPGVSPAQDLVERTTDVLMLGLVPGPDALVLVATLECVIGLCLVSARAMRPAIYLLAVQLIGILSPLVLLPGRLFAGPHGAPTLEGQYVLKDVVLVGAGLVLATTLRGGRLTTAPDHSPPQRSIDPA